MLLAAGLGPVAGADEAGRGACAGPLVAAAVVLDSDQAVTGLKDSKLLSPSTRDGLYDVILSKAAAVSWVLVEAAQCDQMGMGVANLHALRQAVLGLDLQPGFVITDGFYVGGLGVPSMGMWKGDRMADCVSAASIIAKVTRDRIMDDLDAVYPQYEFAKHKGYATALHQKYLDELGPCPQHRLSYGNVARTSRVEAS